MRHSKEQQGPKSRSAGTTTQATDLAQYLIYRSEDPTTISTLQKTGAVEYAQPSASKTLNRGSQVPDCRRFSNRSDTREVC